MKRTNRQKVAAMLVAFIVLVVALSSGTGCSDGPPQGEQATEQTQEPIAKEDAGAAGTETSQAEPSSSQEPTVPDEQPEPSCVPKKEECNGMDDDCNGQIDDLPAKACYTGPSATQDKGICRSGTQLCQGGQWGACTGEILPGKDGAGACDGKDNNCDGQIDEGCSCKDGETQPCGSDEGVCTKGTQTCQSGQWGTCSGGTLPGKEECNDKDDDCDGAVDEDFVNKGKACSIGKGECVGQGTYSCKSDGSIECDAQPKSPQSETCNGKDDDCDGSIDNGLAPLTCGIGPCANSVPACANGAPNTCQPKQGAAETCNGKDDDCDGNIDDGATCPAGQTCTSGTCQGGSGSAYRTGNFQSPGSYTVVGKVSVYKTSSGERFAFSSNFSSSAGPDLYIYLVKASNGAVSGSNYVNLGKLKSTTGTQTYTLNQSSNGYKSIVVWCQRFGVNFGYANLSP
ncbi:MAG: hypothetical protein CL920_02050 [Deltaproteobacteria bacterium]|nr:hypothetical protein [Deltaproteobacteria bacterium]|tara:strand:+ start:5369 stop:6733 length:1365 start_codon:yes stop_codon:yes gene_type:complete